MPCSRSHFARWLPLRRNHKPWKHSSFSHKLENNNNKKKENHTDDKIWPLGSSGCEKCFYKFARTPCQVRDYSYFKSRENHFAQHLLTHKQPLQSAGRPLFWILIINKILTFHVQEALNIHEHICYLRSQQIRGIGEYKNLSPSSANRNFHAATPPFPSRRRRDSSVAIKPHHSAEDVNKPDMLLLKLALNFRATIISFSIFTNVI